MYLGVDVGGTKTLLAVFDDKGEIIEHARFETPKVYINFLDEFKNQFYQLSNNSFKSAAMGIPGRIDPTNRIGLNFGNLAWHNIPIADNIEQITGCPVAIENDAKLAGLFEASLVAEEYQKVLYIAIGTGIGISFIDHGQIEGNLSDSGGGAFLIEHKEKMRPWDKFASGKAIMKQYGKRASDIDIGDTTIWKAVARNLAVGLIDLIALTEPDAVILGGGVATNYPKFIDFLVKDLKRFEAPMITIPPILQAQRTEEAVVYGCYKMARKINANATQPA